MSAGIDEAAEDRRPRVVVGIDGSPGSGAALDWALAAAAARGADLLAVTAFPVDFYWTDAYLADPRRIDAIRDDMRNRAATMIEQARAAAGPGVAGVAVQVETAPGPAAEQLVRHAGGAELLVVGSRGRGAVPSTLLGSVALHCSAHAPCPVVVVHPAVPHRPDRVVVGLDDTPAGRSALRHAVEEARRLGAGLEVVAVHRAMNHWSELYAVVTPTAGQTERQAAERAQKILAEELGTATLDGGVQVHAVEGVPGHVLVARAAGARLLVVGSRSRSRLEGMVLGSVALHCVVAATCPVMVVHPEAAPAAPAAQS